MPELPEVETTARILNSKIKNLRILDVWTDYDSPFNRGKKNVKDKNYFPYFKKEVVGKKVVSVKRRAKNVLINLSGEKTILVHMKMTGHLLFGKYKRDGDKWIAPLGALSDPYNRFVHLAFKMSDGNFLVLSDSRKFAKAKILENDDLDGLGPEPFDKDMNVKIFKERILKRKNTKIKTVLMDQSIIAGVGNIYSDEVLWFSGISPQRTAGKLNDVEIRKLFVNIKKVLAKSIKMGGDSMSDYRNPLGERGGFQNIHKVYQRKGERCLKKRCRGVIKRTMIGGRSSHYCEHCQK